MLDLLMKRRSIRSFKDDQVAKESIDKIVKGALTSPSGRNKMPWEIVVVQDRDTLNKLGKSRNHISAPLESAPLGIAVVANPNLTDLWVEDASILAVIIQLTAQSLGLGSCWIHVNGRLDKNDKSVEDSVKKILNIPEAYRVECMLAIGHPDEEKEAHSEENLDYTKIHYDKF